MKKNLSKAEYVAKCAPSFCEIWFVKKGKHVGTREASQILIDTAAESLRSRSSHGWTCNLLFHQESFHSISTTSLRELQTEFPSSPALLSSEGICSPHFDQSLFSPSIGSRYPFAGRDESNSPDLAVVEGNLYSQLRETRAEAETLRKKAFAELFNCNKLEVEALEAIGKVIVSSISAVKEPLYFFHM